MSAVARSPWYLWPFALVWDVVGWVLRVAGRMVCALLALALMVTGVILTMTVAGAPIGIPLFVFGLLLALRSLF